MEKECPWYVRFNNYMFNRPTKKFKLILSLSILLVIAVSAYLFYAFGPRQTYEEIYDIQFNNYINDNFKEVTDIVIEEGKNIQLNKIPDTVLEYEIKYTEQGIKFNYSLDNEKIISNYYSETSKMPKESEYEKEMEMNIELSKDFKIISETSSLSSIPTHEEYKRAEQLSWILISTAFGMSIIFPIFFVWLFLGLGACISTIIWRRKQTKKSSNN